MNPTRRLAAIMFTDIVGYTALMQENEAQALVIRQRHREVFEQYHTQYRGQIVQYYGDGTLSVFDSAVDAVACAQAIQLALQESPRVPLRIGLHTGDVLLSDTEVIGDGVNIASRVESLAIPGSILLSESLYEYIKNQPEFTVRSLGVFGFKNVTKPLEIFALSVPGLAIPDPRKMTGKFDRRFAQGPVAWFQQLPVWAQYVAGFVLFLILAPIIYFPLMQGNLGASPAGEFRDENGDVVRRTLVPRSEVKSVYVTHFTNTTRDTSLEWMTTGIPYALEMEWDQDPYMYNQYDPGETNNFSLKEMLDKAQEMQHARLLTGTYAYTPQKGYEISLSIYLTQSGTVEKSLTYTGKDFFSLLDTLSRDVKLNLGVPGEHLATVADLPVSQYLTSSLPAYKAFAAGLLGTHSIGYYRVGDLEEALRLDSTFAWAARVLGSVYEAYQRSPQKITALSDQAMRHRKRLPGAFEAEIRQFYYSQHGDDAKALELTRLLAETNPQHINYWLIYLQEAVRQEKYQDALKVLEEFKRQQYDPRIYTSIATYCYFSLKQYKKGIELLEPYLRDHPDDNINQLGLGQMYLALGQRDKARKIFEQGALLSPDVTAFGQFIKHLDYIEAGGTSRMVYAPAAIAGEYWNTSYANIRSYLDAEGNDLYMRTGKQYRVRLYPIDSVSYCTAFGTDISLLPDSTGGVRGFRYYQSNEYRGGALKVNEHIQAAFKAFVGPDPAAAAPAIEAALSKRAAPQIIRRMQAHLAWIQMPDYQTRAARYQRMTGTYAYENYQIVIALSGDHLTMQQMATVGNEPVRLYEYGPGQFFMLENLTQTLEAVNEGGRFSTWAMVNSASNRFALKRVR
ncbi:MAG: adenylate/guanylate cyclase domain-containing protein [Bacteroidia bacterium]|nr:adenylate/guanylate cyclase domain-containing protein [Bacteroidia bacterium]